MNNIRAVLHWVKENYFKVFIVILSLFLITAAVVATTIVGFATIGHTVATVAAWFKYTTTGNIVAATMLSVLALVCVGGFTALWRRRANKINKGDARTRLLHAQRQGKEEPDLIKQMGKERAHNVRQPVIRLSVTQRQQKTEVLASVKQMSEQAATSIKQLECVIADLVRVNEGILKHNYSLYEENTFSLEQDPLNQNTVFSEEQLTQVKKTLKEAQNIYVEINCLHIEVEEIFTQTLQQQIAFLALIQSSAEKHELIKMKQHVLGMNAELKKIIAELVSPLLQAMASYAKTKADEMRVDVSDLPIWHAGHDYIKKLEKYSRNLKKAVPDLVKEENSTAMTLVTLKVETQEKIQEESEQFAYQHALRQCLKCMQAVFDIQSISYKRKKYDVDLGAVCLELGFRSAESCGNSQQRRKSVADISLSPVKRNIRFFETLSKKTEVEDHSSRLLRTQSCSSLPEFSQEKMPPSEFTRKIRELQGRKEELDDTVVEISSQSQTPLNSPVEQLGL